MSDPSYSTSPPPAQASGAGPPSPYGALGDLGDLESPVRTPERRVRRGRRRGDIDGDMQIRPSLSTIWSGLGAVGIGWLLLLAKTEDIAAATVLTGVLLLCWVGSVVHVLTARVRVLADMIEVRLLWRHRVLPLAGLARPVRAETAGQDRLHLRLDGGVHLVTLGALVWGGAALDMLSRRLDAIRATTSTAATLERQYPGSLSWPQRHTGLVVVLAIVALVALVAVAVLVTT